MNKVFVYGTLKSCYHNSGLLRTARFLGEGITVGKYQTASAGIPYVINPSTTEENGTELSVKGELYETDDLTLEDLDGLEGHPHWYERHLINININNGIEEAWCYLMPSGENVADLPTMPVNKEGSVYEY